MKKLTYQQHWLVSYVAVIQMYIGKFHVHEKEQEQMQLSSEFWAECLVALILEGYLLGWKGHFHQRQTLELERL